MTQKEFVIKKLKEGMLSRNYCIYEDEVKNLTGHHITRLGAIIFGLKKNGMEIETINTEEDCFYKLKNAVKSQTGVISRKYSQNATTGQTGAKNEALDDKLRELIKQTPLTFNNLRIKELEQALKAKYEITKLNIINKY